MYDTFLLFIDFTLTMIGDKDEQNLANENKVK